VKILSHRRQRTLLRPAEVSGVGYLTGATVCARFLPAPASSGVVFVRTDLQPQVSIPATVEQVTGTARRTTLGHTPTQAAAEVGLVEHVLAALAGLRIDNCHVELDGPEPPGLDGSAQGFVKALLQAGIHTQSEDCPVWGVESPVVLTQGGATLCLHPGRDAELRISYFLDYGPFTPPGRQTTTHTITPGRFATDVACCRTFILDTEAAELRRQGLGKRTTTADLLVFGPFGPIDNRLRFANEPARHKVLDLIGDLALLGADVRGHLVAYRSGHPLNVELVRTLHRQRTACPGPARQVA
jgi:UDP-3-O-[3-hydroxymyristoyl] N-acetylglucosamine deacetylase